MNKIHFENLTWNWLRISLLIIASVSFMIGYGLILDYENGLISAFGFIIIIILLSKRFWYKNYVEYNKSSIIIKLNITTDKKIKFESIDKVSIDQNRLSLFLSNNNDFTFKVSNIYRDDINKLIRILLENSKPRFIDHRVENTPAPKVQN